MNKQHILSIALFAVCLSNPACANTGNHRDSRADNLADSSEQYSAESLDDTLASNKDENAIINKNQEKIPAGAKALLQAYPDFITGFNNGKIEFADGTNMLYDDGIEKTFTERLDNSNLEDMFYMPYSLPNPNPEYLADAGRSRNEALFKKMYGSSAAAVQKNLVNVPWFGQNVKFTSVNGAAEQLKKVAAELAKYPELRKYLKSSGSFYWRKVRGANRMSAHSYGIAFDIGVDHSDYWLWKNPKASETAKISYTNKIPAKIVEIFQKHGFIWGGAWYHFDTMHFEYRPEILRYAGL